MGYLPPALAACCCRSTVFTRAMLRRPCRTASGLGCWPVARCMRSENCSLRSFTSSSPSSAADCFAAARSLTVRLSLPHLPFHEGGGDGELGAGQAERLARRHLIHAFHLEQHLARLHARDVVLDVALARCPCGLRAASWKSARPGTRGSRSGRRASRSAPSRGAPPRSRARSCAPGSVALRPNSPKETLLPRCARPPLRPLNCLRYLVRLGCSMTVAFKPARAAQLRGRPARQLRAAGAAAAAPARPRLPRRQPAVRARPCRTPRP